MNVVVEKERKGGPSMEGDNVYKGLGERAILILCGLGYCERDNELGGCLWEERGKT